MTTNYWDLKKISKLIFILSLITGNTNGISNDNYMTAIKKSPLDFAAITSQLGSAERMRYGKRNGFDVTMLPHVYKLTEVGKRSNNDNIDKRSNKYLMEVEEYQKLGKRSDNFLPELAKFNEIGKRSSNNINEDFLLKYYPLAKRYRGNIKEITHFYNLGKRSMLSEIGEYDNVGKRSNDYIPQIVEFDKFGKRDSSYLREIQKFHDLGKRSSYNQVLPIYDNAGKRSYYPFYDSDTYYYDSIGKRLSSIIKNVAEYNQVGKRSNGLVPHLIHYDDFGKRTDDFDNLNYYYQHGKRSPNLNAIIQHLNDVDRLRFGK